MLEDHEPVSESAWLAALADERNSLDFALFGFDAVSWDWAFRQRLLPDHLMYLVTDGSCAADIEGTPVELTPGSFLWMQPGMRHTFAVGASPQPLTLYFSRFRLRRDARGLVLRDRPIQQWDGAWELLELMDQFLDELRTQLPFRETRLRGLLLAICAATLRGRETETAHSTGTLTRVQRRAIEGCIRDNLADWPSPRDLADHVHLSLDYFSRLFTQTFGMPPRAWLVQERVRRGARLLSESLQNVSEVAASLGYEDVSAFSHQFKQRYGVSPRAYRQSQR